DLLYGAKVAVGDPEFFRRSSEAQTIANTKLTFHLTVDVHAIEPSRIVGDLDSVSLSHSQDVFLRPSSEYVCVALVLDADLLAPARKIKYASDRIARGPCPVGAGHVGTG